MKPLARALMLLLGGPPRLVSRPHGIGKLERFAKRIKRLALPPPLGKRLLVVLGMKVNQVCRDLGKLADGDQPAAGMGYASAGFRNLAAEDEWLVTIKLDAEGIENRAKRLGAPARAGNGLDYCLNRCARCAFSDHGRIRTAAQEQLERAEDH